MTLYFVGIGIAGVSALSDEVRRAISSVKIVYAERFTSPISDSEFDELKRIAVERGASFKVAPRWMVEDGSEILREALNGDVALVCYGDPYIATTHIELRTRAVAQGTPTHSVHGTSALTSMVGECGLHQYKMGRTTTVTSEEASTPYDILYENMQRGCHTLLLLEYNQDDGKFLAPSAALKSLLDIEVDARHEAATRDTFAIIVSRIGYADQALVAGKIKSLLDVDVGEPPHSIIVPGTLHFTETDAINVLTRCIDKPFANSQSSKVESHRMIAKYVPMIREAIRDEQSHVNGNEGITRVLDNAQSYVVDAEEFLKTGRDELAILSIGYADGLVDALRIINNRPYQRARRANKEGSSST